MDPRNWLQWFPPASVKGVCDTRGRLCDQFGELHEGQVFFSRKIMNVNMSAITANEVTNQIHYKEEFNQVMTEQQLKLFETVNIVIIGGIGGLFGIAGNIINILIFYKQGFRNTVNIAFVGLAISDLCGLISLEWIATAMNPIFAQAEEYLVILEVTYLSAGWPIVCFCRITCYITVYITAERYICIMVPLKVKQLITPRRTTLVICLIYLVNFISFIPEYSTSYLDWKFIPDKNSTLLALFFTSNRQSMEGLSYVIHSLFSTVSFLGVIIFTALLVTKLRQSSEWRKQATSGKIQNETMSTRDQKTAKMVVLIASVLIICYTPGAIFAMATFIVGPEYFSMLGVYANICVSAWSFAGVFQALNSSVNIFLYYKMSSKFRDTFRGIFYKVDKV